jgi:hypothetical protein
MYGNWPKTVENEMTLQQDGPYCDVCGNPITGIDGGMMERLPVGTRIFNGGDRCNPEHFGTITRVIESDRFSPQYEVTPDAESERKPYAIPLCAVSPAYLGHGGTRIVTEQSYCDWRASKIAAMQTDDAE